MDVLENVEVEVETEIDDDDNYYYDSYSYYVNGIVMKKSEKTLFDEIKTTKKPTEKIIKVCKYKWA